MVSLTHCGRKGKRPVSVIQLIMDAKNEARAMPSKIEKFFQSVKKGSV